MKVYHIGEEVLVAVSDETCLGKEFTEGNVHLKVSKEFYGEEYADKDEVVSALCDAPSLTWSASRVSPPPSRTASSTLRTSSTSRACLTLKWSACELLLIFIISVICAEFIRSPILCFS